MIVEMKSRMMKAGVLNRLCKAGMIGSTIEEVKVWKEKQRRRV